MQETWVLSLGWEDPLEKEMTIHSSILFFFTPVFLTGKSHGQRSLVGYSLQGHKESDTAEQVTLSLFTFTKRLFNSFFAFCHKVLSSAYLRLLIFPPKILFPACAPSILAFCMMYSAYKLNKQGNNIQLWCTPFPIWNQSIVPCLVLTVASWPAYRFHRREVRWSTIPISSKNFPQFVVIHTVKGFGIVIEAEVFLEFSCFFYDPVDVGNLISDSSAFSKSTLYIWKFSVLIWLMPSLKNFEHYFASMWMKWVQLCSNLNILWHCPSLGLEWKLISSSPVATAEFSKFAGILSAALSQHHLLGFEIAQLEFHHLH